MPYNIEALNDAPPGKREVMENGTGTGTLYVKPYRSADGVIYYCDIACAGPPSTDDTFPMDSTWRDTLNHKMYYKTGPTTWTAVGSVT